MLSPSSQDPSDLSGANDLSSIRLLIVECDKVDIRVLLGSDDGNDGAIYAATQEDQRSIGLP